ncbi:primosomal protein N' [Lentilactobacillus sp. SPB1-3]|uniref:Primosomal protein N n=1 Tax=Lentilactobacillus terminaliae TaxID=3003483 RepID=A0ACD5DBX9_9LACO|nr:primosomal protein N' [Lentilactobacillus sp. SPB1-3]MCZ0977166.1 primosomal protein N' [Lentilactobacillus sp. SPB1-3]
MQVAKVIVDVPSRQTNKPFSYLIPDNLSSAILVGMRVQVPFGHRKITGFVIEVTDHVDFDGKLKPIDSVIDLTPVISPELMSLAIKMSETTYAFLISCLQTMLPGGMKASMTKKIVATSPQVIADNEELFHGQSEVQLASNTNPQTTSQVLSLIKQELVTVDYDLKRSASAVELLGVQAAMSVEQLTSELTTVRANATGQQQLLKKLIGHPETNFVQADLVKEGISASTVKTAVNRGWAQATKIHQNRDPFMQPVKPSQPLELNKDQQVAVDKVTDAIKANLNECFLLEGVTGSGKTEVYLQIMDLALKQGKAALMLVPEITLTPQIVNRVRSRFGNQVAMLHSAMSNGERYDEWQRINRGEAKVVVGVRSAIFAPINNLGVIIVDEEHDASYKQTDNPRYQTRDVAKFRAEYNHCPVVLGSATPSLESRARAQKGVYQLLRLPHRINDQVLPKVDVVDMREAMKHSSSLLAQALQTKISEKLTRHEQVILMLNRRGYASFLMCRSCGYVPQCPNCDISLTVHKGSHSLKCHYCGHEEPIPEACPQCQSKKIRSFGYGSEQLEEQVHKLFPSAKTLRMDVDTTRKKGAHERIINAFANKEADILLGTQMIAKGLDFPDVTLVGVLNADSALQFPDFRSSERTFELLTQVAGRAGRADKTGEVVIQTYNPNHYAIQLSQRQDYEAFYQKEMGIRRIGKYPPFYYTIKITGNSKNERTVLSQMLSLTNYLKGQLSNQAILLGPTPKMITRINNHYYYQTIIKYRFEDQLKPALDKILTESQKLKDVQLSIDNEPLDFI